MCYCRLWPNLSSRRSLRSLEATVGKQEELVHFDTPRRVADLTTCTFAGANSGRCIQMH